jgi:dephospho-CoA kinase
MSPSAGWSTLGFLSHRQSTVPNMAGRVPRTTGTRVLLGGGIGAGKSTVARLLASDGFRVISADDVGRQALSSGTGPADSVARIWPDVIVDGVIDRAKLAHVVFSDPEELRRLEAVTHPVIVEEIRRLMALHTDENLVVETPLPGLFGDEEFVRIAVVADMDTRLARTVLRGNDADDTRRRMVAQPSDAEWRSWAVHVIDNSGTPEATASEVATVMAKVMTDD